MNQHDQALDTLEEIVSPHAKNLSQQVRILALQLKGRTEETPLAAETLVLATEVSKLCDYVDHLHGSVRQLLAQRDASDSALHEVDDLSDEARDRSAENRKAKEIQHETHQFNPAAKDIIKALFMWRDTPQERLNEDK